MSDIARQRAARIGSARAIAGLRAAAGSLAATRGAGAALRVGLAVASRARAVAPLLQRLPSRARRATAVAAGADQSGTALPPRAFQYAFADSRRRFAATLASPVSSRAYRALARSAAQRQANAAANAAARVGAGTGYGMPPGVLRADRTRPLAPLRAVRAELASRPQSRPAHDPGAPLIRRMPRPAATPALRGSRPPAAPALSGSRRAPAAPIDPTPIAPPHAPAPQHAGRAPSASVPLDETQFGVWITEHLTAAATRPPSGLSGLDDRLSPVFAGMVGYG